MYIQTNIDYAAQQEQNDFEANVRTSNKVLLVTFCVLIIQLRFSLLFRLWLVAFKGPLTLRISQASAWLSSQWFSLWLTRFWEKGRLTTSIHEGGHCGDPCYHLVIRLLVLLNLPQSSEPKQLNFLRLNRRAWLIFISTHEFQLFDVLSAYYIIQIVVNSSSHFKVPKTFFRRLQSS